MKATYNTIDWEQRRYELAKSAMNGILSNENEVGFSCYEVIYGKNETKAIAQHAVACADALIEELRKGGSND